MEQNLDDMIDHPEKYGFIWGYGHLEADGKRVTMGQGAPRIEHKNLDLLKQTFGEQVILTQYFDGTSPRVLDQTIRNVLKTDKALAQNDRGMKRWVLEKRFNLLPKNRKTVVHEDHFFAVDGTEFKTADEAKEYSKLVMAQDALVEKAEALIK